MLLLPAFDLDVDAQSLSLDDQEGIKNRLCPVCRPRDAESNRALSCEAANSLRVRPKALQVIAKVIIQISGEHVGEGVSQPRHLILQQSAKLLVECPGLFLGGDLVGPDAQQRTDVGWIQLGARNLEADVELKPKRHVSCPGIDVIVP